MINLPAARVTFSLRDGSGSLAHARLHLGLVEIGTARAAAAAMAAALRALTGCSVERWTINYQTTLDDPKPTSGAPALQRGLFVWRTAVPDAYAVTAVPGLWPALVETTGAGAGVQISMAAPAVGALVAVITAAPWSSPFGADITALDAAIYQIDP